MKRVAFHTLGCKLNFTETSAIGRQFAGRNFSVVDIDQPTDVYVLNTCSVTERADRECRQIVRRALRRSPDAYVIVIGCYAQLQHGELSSMQGVDLILGTNEKFRIFDFAGGFVKQPVSQVFVSCIDDATEFDAAASGEVGERTRAFLKIQDGCDYPCSFCTIPLARGTSRSVPVPAIVGQARDLVREGYREIVLTGVNVGDYGRKIGTSLLDLLTRLDDLEGLARIRISSIEPNLLTPKLIAFILKSRTICNHFHIPLQSGSDTVLRMMRRRYVTEYYREVIASIKAADPDAGIGVDVIVGFPGETETLFDETRDFLFNLPLSYLHVFSYSERPNTPAAAYGGSVDPRIRSSRSEILRILGRKKRHAFMSGFMGRSVPVLFEEGSDPVTISGLTPNYIRVHMRRRDDLTNRVADVLITRVDGDSSSGSLVVKKHDNHHVRSEYHANIETVNSTLTHSSQFTERQ